MDMGNEIVCIKGHMPDYVVHNLISIRASMYRQFMNSPDNQKSLWEELAGRLMDKVGIMYEPTKLKQKFTSLMRSYNSITDGGRQAGNSWAFYEEMHHLVSLESGNSAPQLPVLSPSSDRTSVSDVEGSEMKDVGELLSGVMQRWAAERQMWQQKNHELQQKLIAAEAARDQLFELLKSHPIAGGTVPYAPHQVIYTAPAAEVQAPEPPAAVNVSYSYYPAGSSFGSASRNAMQDTNSWWSGHSNP